MVETGHETTSDQGGEAGSHVLPHRAGGAHRGPVPQDAGSSRRARRRPARSVRPGPSPRSDLGGWGTEWQYLPKLSTASGHPLAPFGDRTAADTTRIPVPGAQAGVGSRSISLLVGIHLRGRVDTFVVWQRRHGSGSGCYGRLRIGVAKARRRRVLTNDDCWGLPSADQGLCRRLACRWWIAQYPPSSPSVSMAQVRYCGHLARSLGSAGSR